MKPIKIIIYTTRTKKEPYSDWENELDNVARSIIISRLDRIRLGNFGDAKVIKGGEGIWELRIDFGPGYRIYFGKEKEVVVILLTGGEKKSQDRDIQKAKRYWQDYKELL